MLVTIKQILDAQPAFMKLLNADVTVALSYKNRKAVQAVNAELQLFEAERQLLLDKHCKKDPEGERTLLPNGDVKFASAKDAAAFMKCVEELFAQKTNLNIEYIDFNELVREPKLALSAVDIVNLQPFSLDAKSVSRPRPKRKAA